MKSRDIVRLLGKQTKIYGFRGFWDNQISGVCSIFSPKDSCLTFCNNEMTCNENGTNYCTIIAPKDFNPTFCQEDRNTYILVENPRLAFTRALKFFLEENGMQPFGNVPGIDHTAIIDPEATIHETVSIGPYCVIGKCSIGENTTIGPFTVVYDNTIIGKNVVIRDHCSLGGDGFGFTKNEQGHYEKMPHIGKTVIEDNVELYPYNNVDRGALFETRVKRGTKIDHFSHISHNVTIGEDSLIPAGAVFCGGSSLGKNSYLGAGSTVKENVTIHDNVLIGMGSVVIEDIPSDTVAYGNPCKVARKNK